MDYDNPYCRDSNCWVYKLLNRYCHICDWIKRRQNSSKFGLLQFAEGRKSWFRLYWVLFTNAIVLVTLNKVCFMGSWVQIPMALWYLWILIYYIPYHYCFKCSTNRLVKMESPWIIRSSKLTFYLGWNVYLYKETAKPAFR